MTNIIELDSVESGYGSSVVVRNISVAVAPGEILAIVGKNGMGKTSLLKTAMGFLAVRSGKVRVSGQDVTHRPPHIRRNLALAYAPQEKTIFQDLTVRENLRLALSSDRGFDARFERVTHWFPVLGQRFRQRAGTLSGGEQKMLIVARGMLMEPKIFLLDEVAEGLQPSVVDRLGEALARMREDTGTALLIVEQHIPFVMSLADRFAIIKAGEIVETGIAHPENSSVIEDHIRI
jgi:ABC-type branched-subunit amino acid transport system ATPase component